jgi:hypothetical protein
MLPSEWMCLAFIGMKYFLNKEDVLVVSLWIMMINSYSPLVDTILPADKHSGNSFLCGQSNNLDQKKQDTLVIGHDAIPVLYAPFAHKIRPL